MLRVLLLVVTIIATASVCSANANMLEEIITLSSMSPAAFADSLASSGLAQIVQLEKTPSLHIAADSSAYRPVVLSHGMGDAATNSGMVEIR